jgi:O-antigen ligase
MQMTHRRTITLPRVTIVAILAAVILGLAIAIAFDKVVLGIEIAILASAPVLLYVAYRWPMIFPVGLYILSVPVDPLLKVSSGAGSTLTKYIGLATIAALLVHAFRSRRLYAPPTFWYAWGAYIFLCVLSIAWSVAPDDTSAIAISMVTLFALFTATAMYPITEQTYRIARGCAALAGVLTGLYGIYAYTHGQRYFGGRLVLSQGVNYFDPNHYAAFFCIPIGIVAGWLFFSRSARNRFIAALSLALMFANVLLTGSRGGFIAAAIVILYVGFRARRYALLGWTFVAGLIFSFCLPNIWVRMLDPTQGDASGRGEIWNVGIAAIREYGLFGCGFGDFAYAYQENLNNAAQRTFAGYGRPAHNIVIQTFTELGVAGLIILIAAWWTTVRQNSFIPRASAYFMDRSAYEGAAIGLFVCALTIDLLWFKYLWLCLTLIAMLSNVVRPTILLGRRTAMPRPQTATPPAAVRAHARLG